MLRRLFLLLVFLLTPVLARAQNITPQLVAEGPAPPGGEVELAIHMRPAPGWHGYWQNPGDAGLPMDVKWQLPKGFVVGPLRYPVPARLEVAGLINYVYERDYAVLVRVKVPADAKGIVPIRADAHWLACTDRICVPEQGELSLDLSVGMGTPNRPQFDEWRRALPQPLASTARFSTAGNRLRLAVPLPGSVKIEQPYVFPLTDGAVDYAAKQHFRRSGDWVIADLQRRNATPATFDGVIALGDGRGLQFHAVPGAVAESGMPLGGLGSNAVLWAALGAILGGMLLNLMPCVFPILALKALHMSRAGGDAREAKTDALGYAAGAIVGTGSLGLVLLAIRAAGMEAGWAFQLQDPRMIMLLLLLAVAITANLVGLFEVPVLGGNLRPVGGFGTGALAAFVATPCAGPFLGAALGAALLLPLGGSVLVFAGLGLGLALPFLLVAFVPAIRDRIPRPGLWMKRLQRILAIPMGATVIACLWLLERQAGTRGLLIALAAVAALTVLVIWYGFAQRREASEHDDPAILVFSMLVIIIAMWQVPDASAAAHRVKGADRWSEPAVASELAANHPVFVYFTADWCLTCKANEAAAIDRGEVRAAFRKAGVRVLAGDWTNGDPAITRFLESQGRAGVPLYLWYVPGKAPEELPQVLTPSMLISRAQAPR
jgi:DsbC/DsbD-like thiol-disulfide interchange protein/cytochrome c biogenesis protein CcdA